MNEQQEEAIQNKKVTLLLLDEVERMKKAIEAEEALESRAKAQTDTKKKAEDEHAAKVKLAVSPAEASENETKRNE